MICRLRGGSRYVPSWRGPVRLPGRVHARAGPAGLSLLAIRGPQDRPTIRGCSEYIEKWFRKECSAPAEEIAHFDHQRAVLRMPMAERPPEGPSVRFLAKRGVPQSGAVPDGDDRPYVAFERGGIRFSFFAPGWGVNNLGAAADQPGLRFSFLTGLAPEDGRPVDLRLPERALDAMTADGVDFKIFVLHWNFESE